MDDRKQAGDYGEALAERYLIEKGCQILETKYRCRTGEIDIIAAHGGYIVFVEVKYRRSLRFGYPREAVTKSKQHVIRRTALHYITMRQQADRDYRFDVIEIIDDGEQHIEHIENAF